MFSGPYGVSEDGTYSESIAVRREDLCLVPDNIDDATAGGMPVAYLTAQITLMQAGFAPGKIVLAPAIGGADLVFVDRVGERVEVALLDRQQVPAERFPKAVFHFLA